jgi:glycosyltransferase involved in cell wall biosynthesis
MPRQNNLKIVFYDRSGRGGVSHYTYQLAESLACNGNDVTVITSEDYELKHLKRSFELYIPFTKSWVKSFLHSMFSPLLKKSVSDIDHPNVSNIHSTLNQQKSTVSLLLETSRLWIIWIRIVIFLLWKNPHVIHFQWLIDKKNTFYFMRILKMLRFTIVYTAHDLLPHGDNSQDSQSVFRKIYCISDKIIVHSESNKREIIEIFKIDAKKVYIIPHGSFDVFYKDKNITKCTARKEIKIPDGKMVILFLVL